MSVLTIPCLVGDESGYRGSATTRLRVENVIRERYGDQAAQTYDPLHNCLTFRQWLKAGYRVRKGEKAISSITMLEDKSSTGEVVRRYPKTVFLFFHTQVEPIDPPS